MAESSGNTVDTSIYKSQQSQPNPLDTITKLGSVMDAIGGMSAGNAIQQSLQPNGTFDENKLTSILRTAPGGGLKALPTMHALQQLKQQGFATDQAGMETFQKRMAITHHLFSGLASKKDPTINDVYDIAAQALDPNLNAKKYGITNEVIRNVVNQFEGLNPAQIKAKALQLQTQAASTGEILGQHSPQMSAVDRGGNIEFVPTGTGANPATGTVVPKNLPPGTTVATPQGPQYLGEQPAPPPAAVPAPPGPADVQVGPRGQPKQDQGRAPAGSRLPTDVQPAAPVVTPMMTNPQQQAMPFDPDAPIQPKQVKTIPVVPRGPMQGMTPGYAESQAGQAAAGTALVNRVVEANDTSPQRMAILGTMENLMKNFEPGRGADWTLFAKNMANRNLPIPKSWQKEGGVFDVKSVGSQEEFNKLAYQLAQAQFAALGGTGTDAKLDSAMHTSPNELLSRYGNQGIMRLLKGNELAMQAKAKAWQEWKKEHGPDTGQEFSTDFNSHFDPRSFQFKYMTPAERDNYIREMDPVDRPSFLKNMAYAHMQGWIDYTTPKAK